jgi:putative flippase GtrA
MTSRVAPFGQKVRFLIVGAWNTFFGLALFYALIETRHTLNYQITLLCSFVLSTVQSHFSQRIFVWKSKQKYLAELSRFFLGTSIFYFVNAVLLPVLVEGVGLRVFISQCAITFFLTIASYFFQSKFVFSISKNRSRFNSAPNEQ